MSIKIYPVKEQARGEFDGGKIRENKPIGFPQDGDGLKPYSNLFYWAHAWSDNGGVIGMHPHQVFEIMSFVLKGTIEHYDTKNRKWIPLHEGDVQIIRAGSGISHSEKINPGGEIFQIWLDPDIRKTAKMPATYDDYSSDSFPVTEENGMNVKIFMGGNSPMKMETPGVSIKEYSFTSGKHALPLDAKKVYSFYLIDGQVKTNEGQMGGNDFAVMNGGAEFNFTASSDGKLFVIESPSEVPYRTYAQER
jgi:hypothetical protein